MQKEEKMHWKAMCIPVVRRIDLWRPGEQRAALKRLLCVIKVSSAIISLVEVTDTESVTVSFLPLTSFS